MGPHGTCHSKLRQLYVAPGWAIPVTETLEEQKNKHKQQRGTLNTHAYYTNGKGHDRPEMMGETMRARTCFLMACETLGKVFLSRDFPVDFLGLFVFLDDCVIGHAPWRKVRKGSGGLEKNGH